MVWTLVLGGAALVGFLAWQRRAARPMIPLRLFTDRTFASAIAGIVLQSASLTVVVFFTAQFLQDAQGNSPLAAGLHLLPLGLVPRWCSGRGPAAVPTAWGCQSNSAVTSKPPSGRG